MKKFSLEKHPDCKLCDWYAEILKEIIYSNPHAAQEVIEDLKDNKDFMGHLVGKK